MDFKLFLSVEIQNIEFLINFKHFFSWLKMVISLHKLANGPILFLGCVLTSCSKVFWNSLFFQITHFLFSKLDKDKCESSFRDCWPSFDKKMEAEFRKICFEWYKEIQSTNPGLPSITLSLFQSPGGRKFITFITSFIRFVSKDFLHKVLQSNQFMKL